MKTSTLTRSWWGTVIPTYSQGFWAQCKVFCLIIFNLNSRQIDPIILFTSTHSCEFEHIIRPHEFQLDDRFYRVGGGTRVAGFLLALATAILLFIGTGPIAFIRESPVSVPFEILTSHY